MRSSLSISRRALVAGALIALGNGTSIAQASGNGWFSWLSDKVVRRIDLKGYRRLGFHSETIEGDRQAYQSTNLSGLGGQRFTDLGQMRIEGKKVLGFLNFQMQLQDSRFQDPQGQKMTLEFERSGWKATAGDMQGSLLNTNRFASLSKTMRGASIGFTGGRLSFKALRSESRGDARTVVLQGNNSSGPYYLQSSQLVADSETVRLDGQMMRLGSDYVIDYELGSITFVNRLVPPTSSIVVSYEALGYGGESGSLQGAGVSYDLGAYGRLGVTALQQRAGGAGGLRTRSERFQGFGAPSTPYFLQFEPLLSRPVVVKVDGILQTRDVDYRFDTGNPSIFYFNRFMPPTSDIEVLYTPKPRGAVSGDRDVFGIDYRLPLGKRGTRGALTLTQATGRALGEANPSSGTARGLDLRYDLGALVLDAGWRDVPQDFVSLQSRGIQRNERATEFSLAAKPVRGLSYGLSAARSSITSRVTRPDGSLGFLPSSFSSLRAYANLQPERATGAWTLEHTRTSSVASGRGTHLSSTILSTSQRQAGVDWKLSLERQDGSGPLLSGSEYRQSRISLNTMRLSAAYALAERLKLSAAGSLSSIQAAGQNGSGSDLSATLAYTPSERLQLTSSYVASDSGQLTTLGQFQSGYGLGYDSSGFGGGGGTTSPLLGATNTRLWLTSLNYRISDRFSLSARHSATQTEGSVSSNSRTNAYGLGLSADFGPSLQLEASLDRSATTLFGSGQDSTATMLNLFVAGASGKRLTYRGGMSLALNGGNSPYRQNYTSFESTISYLLAPRQTLSLSAFTGQTKGYYPQNDFDASLTYQYKLWDVLGLNLRYRFRDVRNLDSSVNTGAYRAKGLDLELEFIFGQ